jgi:hypothetical protein
MAEIEFKKSDYPEVRAALLALHERIMKVVGTDEIKKCARELGLLHKKTLAFKNEAEAGILFDYIIYSYRPHGFNMAEKYLRLNQARLNELDTILLSCMSRAYYSILSLTDINETGEVHAKDLLQQRNLTIIDNTLSKNGLSGMVIAGHIINFEAFSIQTGAALSIDRQLMETEEVLRFFDAIYGGDEAEENLVLSADKTAKLARATLAAAIRLGYTEVVESRGA